MLLRSQATPPFENTRSRSRSRVDSKLPKRDIKTLSKSSSRSTHTGPGKGKSKRRAGSSQDNGVLGILDMRAAEAGLDQAHIVDYPGWKILNVSGELEDVDQDMEDIINEDEAEARYTEEFTIVLYQLSHEDGKWVDLGPGKLTLEADLRSSRAVVRMIQTHRILVHWIIFGGMKVARFLTTVIVVAIVTQDDDIQEVVSYGLKVDTLERARELAVLLSSNSRGMQTNLERLIPKLTAEQRAEILENMTERLLILRKRLGGLDGNSELSEQVESELVGMLATGAELK